MAATDMAEKPSDAVAAPPQEHGSDAVASPSNEKAVDGDAPSSGSVKEPEAPKQKVRSQRLPRDSALLII